MPSLEAFARATDCVLVVTQPDRPAGRGHALHATPVKAAARALGLATIEPERMREALPAIGAVAPDLFAVASYGKILPQALLDVPPLGALNVHPSVLPLYRGATPLQTQVRDGVRESGVSIIFMDAGMDTGDIVLVRRSRIGDRETYGELHDRFAMLGGALLAEACALAAAGEATRLPQSGLADEAQIERTLTRPLEKADLVIEWTWSARRIVDHVRSLAPAPGARARLDGEAQAVKLLETRVAAGPGDGAFVVPCGDGEYVEIERLVPPNRGPLDGRAYRAARAARDGRGAGARA